MDSNVTLILKNLPPPQNDCKVNVPTKRTVLRRKELKLQPPALMLLSDLGHVFSLDCIQYIRPSPIIIYREEMYICVRTRMKHKVEKG